MAVANASENNHLSYNMTGTVVKNFLVTVKRSP